MKPSSLDLAAAIVGVLVASLWLGGLLVLGALVAPVVFGIVPAPTSGDAMTVVFRRFDEVSLGCAAIAGVCEAVRARAGGVSRVDVIRIACVAIAVASTLAIAVWISPSIAALHASGAVRGVGPLGEQLDRTHDWATRIAKLEALCIAVVIALHVVPRGARRSREDGKSQRAVAGSD